jgi:soluble lytic murein transglycosylase-like protein
MATLTPAQLCQVARKGDAEAMNQLAWAYSHGQGVERSDAYAAYLFFAASSAGHEGAKRMLNSVSWPPAEVPPCLDEASPSIYAPTGPPVAVEAPPHIEKLVKKLAPKYQLDPKLVTAVMSVESNFNAFALSPKNAMGLMQLMPDTAKRFGVRKPFDAQDNMQGGMAYLRWLLAYFEGDLVLVAAGYNAGEGAVEKHKGVPPFAETQDYVRRVLERVGTAQHPFNAKVTTPSSALKLINKTASR